jgi:hypothetical protein
VATAGGRLFRELGLQRDDGGGDDFICWLLTDLIIIELASFSFALYYYFTSSYTGHVGMSSSVDLNDLFEVDEDVVFDDGDELDREAARMDGHEEDEPSPAEEDAFDEEDDLDFENYREQLGIANLEEFPPLANSKSWVANDPNKLPTITVL